MGLQRLLRHALDRAVRILGVELVFDDGGQGVGTAAEEAGAVPASTDQKRQGQTVGIRLVDRGEGLVHVLRPAFSPSRHTERKQYEPESNTGKAMDDTKMAYSSFVTSRAMAKAWPK